MHTESRPAEKWTDERVATMRSLLSDGYSAADVAVELGVTRKAVLGKAQRMDGTITKPPRTDVPRPQAFDVKLMEFMPYLKRLSIRWFFKNKADREDFVNEVIASCLSRWASYREDGNFFGWLHFQAREVRQNIIRRARGHENNLPIENHDAPISGGQEYAVDLSHALKILSMHRFGDRVIKRAEGYDLGELARHYGISKQRVYQQSTLALKHLNATVCA